jgi:hypothetical protein
MRTPLAKTDGKTLKGDNNELLKIALLDRETAAEGRRHFPTCFVIIDGSGRGLLPVWFTRLF